MRTSLKIAAAFFVLIGILLLNGCNTAKGFGEDLEKGGQKIQKAATTS